MVEDQRFLHQRVDDRRRIGEPGGFQHDALEAPDFAGFAARVQVDQGRHQVAADGAADAAAGQVDDAFVGGFDQQVVEPDLAELVDDDGGILERRIAQDFRQDRGLAAAEKAGQHGDGNKRVFGHGRKMS